jgi:pyruvate/2-oxoglutarate dehydrogenase complex dihydrolipoamide acyltransferase (E2) component
MSTFTTHLICVPELEETACVSTVHILPGQHVHSNTPLLTLVCGDGEIEICAPEAGLVSHIMVEIKEIVQCGDLLLQMEIEEEPLQLFGAETTFASACQLDWPTPQTTTLSVSLNAARLAARLGVDLSTVAARGECIEEADIEAHVRSIMQEWQQPH